MPGQLFNPVFFEEGRAVHLEDKQTGLTFCGRNGGRWCWIPVPVDVPNGCRRCVAIAKERA